MHCFGNVLKSGEFVDFMALSLELPSQKGRELMESVHTCDGNDVSPEITWSGVPEGAKSLALLMEDPDAPVGTFFHWSIYNIRADETGLPAELPKSETTPSGHAQGFNDFQRIGYYGPCPPGKKPHNYVFTLYATSQEPNLAPGLKKNDLRRILDAKTIEKASFTIKYTRSRN